MGAKGYIRKWRLRGDRAVRRFFKDGSIDGYFPVWSLTKDQNQYMVKLINSAWINNSCKYWAVGPHRKLGFEWSVILEYRKPPSFGSYPQKRD